MTSWIKSNIPNYLNAKNVCMVPTAKEILFDISRSCPGQNYHFSGQSIQDLKVINKDMCKKVFDIYSMYDRLFYGTAPSSPLLAV